MLLSPLFLFHWPDGLDGQTIKSNGPAARLLQIVASEAIHIGWQTREVYIAHGTEL
jgi:hypothetical protein